MHHYLRTARHHLGLILGLGRLAQAPHGIWKPILHYGVQWPVRIYISAFRGTPLFVQIMVVHFALVPLFINPRDGLLVTSGLMSVDFARAARRLRCLSLLRSGDHAQRRRLCIGDLPRRDPIDRSRPDGGLALAGHELRQDHAPGDPAAGLPPYAATAGQQRHRHRQDSSLASAIGLADLAYAARTVSGAYATYWEPYLTISLVYWVITFLLSLLVQHMEKRFGKSDSRT